MVRKFFPLDKNYLLEEVQLGLQDALLTQLVAQAMDAYQLAHNPLGLNDDFSEIIREYQPGKLQPLQVFYLSIAGVYRFKYGENQLGFLWDGRDHKDKYGEDWSSTFHEWCKLLCQQSQFVQAVLDLTVFLPKSGQAQMAENRMNAVMQNLFELKFHKQKGIVHMKMA